MSSSSVGAEASEILRFKFLGIRIIKPLPALVLGAGVRPRAVVGFRVPCTLGFFSAGMVVPVPCWQRKGESRNEKARCLNRKLLRFFFEGWLKLRSWEWKCESCCYGRPAHSNSGKLEPRVLATLHEN